ncbi:uncharacterized protein LOC144867371 [Branchiostoma floridae x Branchiostoma japonicum]
MFLGPYIGTTVGIVIAFECISLCAIIVMTTILVADKCEAYTVMKYTSIVGPLVGCALAIVVIVVQCVPPNSGFVLIVTQASIAAGLNVLAAGSVLHQCCSKTSSIPGDEPDIPGFLMGFQFSVGCMVGLGGTIAAAFNVEPGTGTAGIVFGAICTVGIVAVFIWFVCRVCCCKPTGSNDKSFKITA